MRTPSMAIRIVGPALGLLLLSAGVQADDTVLQDDAYDFSAAYSQPGSAGADATVGYTFDIVLDHAYVDYQDVELAMFSSQPQELEASEFAAMVAGGVREPGIPPDLFDVD